MEFEWDSEKARRNRRKHGVSFNEAATVFSDVFEITVQDPEHSAHEDRFVSIGTSAAGTLLVVGYIERRDTIRIIFARRATRRERHAYEDR